MKQVPKKLGALLAAITLTSPLFGYQKEISKEPCPVLCSIFPLDATTDCCKNLHIDLGLLYFQPSISEAVAGIETEKLRDININNVEYDDEAITILRPCFDYTIGLTASLGYLTKHDNWYVGTRFDYLSSSTTTSYNYIEQRSKSIYVYFPWQGTDDFDEYDSALYDLQEDPYPRVYYTGSVNLYFLDALLSRGSFHSKNFSYEPFAGVKAIWFYTNQKKEYFTPANFDGDDPFNGYYQIRMQNWGAGPMFGFNGEYALSCCISIFSDSDIALLYGESNETRNTRYNSYSGDELQQAETSEKTGNIDCAIFLPVRSSLGLKFSRSFFEDRHHLALKIGYDVRAIFAFPDVERGLYLNGLYTNLIWNF